MAFGDEAQLEMFDVWESQEAFDAFGEPLIPILQELGVRPRGPAISAVQNVID